MDKSKLLEVFIQYLVPILCTAIGSGLIWITKKASDYLGTLTSASKTAAGLRQLAFLIEITVAEVEAELRPLVKEFSADGKLSKEEGERLKKAALDKVVTLAKERGFEEARKLLEIAAPSAQQLLSGLLERTVAALPKNAVPVIAAPVIPTLVAPNP